MEQQQVQTECHRLGFRRTWLQGPVDGEQDVGHAGGVEGGGGGDTFAGSEGEVAGEGFDGAVDAVTAGAAEFDEIFRGWDGDQEPAAGMQHAAELGRVHAGGNGDDGGEGAIGIGNGAVGIGNDPGAGGVLLRRGVDGGDGDIDAVGGKAGLGGERTEIEAFAAAGVEDGFLGLGGEHGGDAGQKRRGDATGVQAAAGGDGIGGVAGVFGFLVLGLKEVNVAAAGDVERMAAAADPEAGVAEERFLAVANGAKEHGGSSRKRSFHYNSGLIIKT